MTLRVLYHLAQVHHIVDRCCNRDVGAEARQSRYESQLIETVIVKGIGEVDDSSEHPERDEKEDGVERARCTLYLRLLAVEMVANHRCHQKNEYE